jgi:hypothetical protein
MTMVRFAWQMQMKKKYSAVFCCYSDGFMMVDTRRGNTSLIACQHLQSHFNRDLVTIHSRLGILIDPQLMKHDTLAFIQNHREKEWLGGVVKVETPPRPEKSLCRKLVTGRGVQPFPIAPHTNIKHPLRSGRPPETSFKQSSLEARSICYSCLQMLT